MAKAVNLKTWQLAVLADGLRHSNPVDDIFAPTPITGLVVGTRTTSSVQFNWNVSTDPSAPVTYEVEVDGNFIFTTSSPTFTVTGLGFNQTVNVRVRARDAEGNFTNFVAASGASLTGGTPAAVWPEQAADGRIHVIPGVNCHGSDSFGGSGRNTSNNVDIIIVNDLGNSNTGLGPSPALRTLTTSRLQRSINQCRNRINAVPDSSQYINSVAGGGGWLPISTVTWALACSYANWRRQTYPTRCGHLPEWQEPSRVYANGRVGS